MNTNGYCDKRINWGIRRKELSDPMNVCYERRMNQGADDRMIYQWLAMIQVVVDRNGSSLILDDLY